MPEERVERGPATKEQKRYVLSRYDHELGCHMPLTKEEIIDFAMQNKELSTFFNDP